eukprot:TRINITY_DN91312_c0_g1_i1.p1 TRINITY_DN91312_c0_g1~~TRINITY_DN91312_c0_g1_i1.p1  ORF type:complete len:446 (+),score=102.89 TRINITY_DN91312_c0_g1_i1:83-1420(+)
MVVLCDTWEQQASALQARKDGPCRHNVASNSSSQWMEGGADKENVAPPCANVLDITVKTIAGDALAKIRCSPSDTVYEVKQRLARYHRDASEQLLVSGCRVMRDCDLLSAYSEDSADQAELDINCVRVVPSGITTFLSGESGKDTASQRQLHACLAEMADSVLAHEHRQSQRRKPSSELVRKAIPEDTRARLVTWMLEAFGAFQLCPQLLFNCVLSLDRYCAAMNNVVPQTDLAAALCAVMASQLKLLSPAFFPHGDWQRLLKHLCQDRFPLPDIMKKEGKVLEILDYVVELPTSINFYETLCLRLRAAAPGDSGLHYCNAAFFLLHIALLDLEVQYRYPHCVLAAGAISAALGICEAEPERHAELMADLQVYQAGEAIGDFGSLADAVHACEEDLLMLWADVKTGVHELSDHFRPFVQRFAAAVRNMCPAARLAHLRQSRLHED